MANDISKALSIINKNIEDLKSGNEQIREMIENLASAQKENFARVDKSLILISATLRGPLAEDLKEIKLHLGLEPRDWVEEQKVMVRRIKLPE
jgi:uncharacterized phage infection (PIP) family protein YhgE